MTDQEPGKTAKTCGHEFVWTEEHPQVKDIERMLFSYDKLANDALERIDALSPPGSEKAKGCPMDKRDMYALLEQYSESDETVGKLWREITDIPEWVDWNQIRRGQKVVYQYHAQMQLGVSHNTTTPPTQLTPSASVHLPRRRHGSLANR